MPWYSFARKTNQPPRVTDCQLCERHRRRCQRPRREEEFVVPVPGCMWHPVALSRSILVRLARLKRSRRQQSPRQCIRLATPQIASLRWRQCQQNAYLLLPRCSVSCLAALSVTERNESAARIVGFPCHELSSETSSSSSCLYDPLSVEKLFSACATQIIFPVCLCAAATVTPLQEPKQRFDTLTQRR